MATVNWQGDDVRRKVYAAVEGAGRAVGGNTVTVAQRINRAERFKTGEMTEGWHLVGVFNFGSIVRIVVANNVYHAIFQDRGTTYIEPAYISFRALDEVAPTLPREIASRL